MSFVPCSATSPNQTPRGDVEQCTYRELSSGENRFNTVKHNPRAGYLQKESQNTFCPDTSIRAALKALIDENIPLVEYGSEVLYRTGHEKVQPVVEWAIPDEAICFASQVLLEHDFPRLTPPKRARYGSWGVAGFIHDVYDLQLRDCEQIHLLPLSLVDFTLDETVLVPSTFDTNFKILTPKPPRYFLSLIRNLLRLDFDDPSRTRVQTDLLWFISAYVLHESYSGERYDLKAESEEDFQKSVERGLEFMKRWDWGDVEQRYLDLAAHIVRDPNCSGAIRYHSSDEMEGIE